MTWGEGGVKNLKKRGDVLCERPQIRNIVLIVVMNLVFIYLGELVFSFCDLLAFSPALFLRF